jgi:hypothetical protein
MLSVEINLSFDFVQNSVKSTAITAGDFDVSNIHQNGLAIGIIGNPQLLARA